MTESKKGHNFAIQGPTEKKKIRVRLFFVLMLHIKFQVPSSSSSLFLQPTKGVMDRRTDSQTDRPKPICPLNFFEVGSIKMVSNLSQLFAYTVYPNVTMLFANDLLSIQTLT